MNNKDRINTCEFFDICEAACGGTLEDTEMCNCYGLFKQLKRKEQECEQEKALKETYFTCYKAKHGDITGKLFKRKQTLIDIKGIVEENFYFLDCDYRWILEQILQKIRECEVK